MRSDAMFSHQSPVKITIGTLKMLFIKKYIVYINYIFIKDILGAIIATTVTILVTIVINIMN